MAEPDISIRVLFSLALATLLLAVAVYLVFAPPASRAKRLLGLYLALLAFGELTILESLLGPADAAARATLLGVRFDLRLLRGFVLAAFLWTYPSTPPLRSGHTALFAAVAGLYLAGAGLHLGAREATTGGVQPLAFLYDLATRGGFFLGPVALLASALWRADARGPPDRRGAFTLLVLVLAFEFTNRGVGLHSLAAAAGGAPGFGRYWAGLAAWPGDCCGLALGLSAAVEVLGWAMVLGLAGLRRHYLAAALAGFGFLYQVLPPPPINLFSQNYLFAALGPLVVAHRHRALGPPEAPPWAGALLAGLAAVVAFILVATTVLWVFPGSALGLVLGVFLGLAACVATGIAVAPPGLLGLAPLGDGDDTAARVAAYRSALQAEIAAGQPGEAIRAKLRELRAQLGISEREHAVMEHTLRAGAAGAGGRSVALEPGRRFLDRYRVLRPLGEGGAAATYLCRDDQVGRDVVLKRLRAPTSARDGLDAVLHEARAIGALHHPHVVTLYDVERVGGEAFIVMEHAAGGSLAARLARGPLTPGEFRRLAADVLQGLEAVHAARLVHRDVKPSNVLLTAGGRAKLADFGVAHIRGFETTFIPGDQAAVGTVRFMSPEQARGKPCTPRSDLFSAGATLYEAYTGQPYLEAGRDESAVELQLRAAQGRAFRGDGLPPGLRAWFAKALDPDPAGRFADAAAMRAALDRALGPGAGPRPGRAGRGA